MPTELCRPPECCVYQESYLFLLLPVLLSSFLLRSSGLLGGLQTGCDAPVLEQAAPAAPKRWGAGTAAAEVGSAQQTTWTVHWQCWLVTPQPLPRGPSEKLGRLSRLLQGLHAVLLLASRTWRHSPKPSICVGSAAAFHRPQCLCAWLPALTCCCPLRTAQTRFAPQTAMHPAVLCCAVHSRPNALRPGPQGPTAGQQGSPEVGPHPSSLGPQRLHQLLHHGAIRGPSEDWGGVLCIVLPIRAAHKSPRRPRRGHQQLLQAALACSIIDMSFACAKRHCCAKQAKSGPQARRFCRLLCSRARGGTTLPCRCGHCHALVRVCCNPTREQAASGSELQLPSKSNLPCKPGLEISSAPCIGQD